ncbi:FtsX-like permease family protein [Sphaerisporangium sp. TRM90804]|uniref:FtsX-like permease family protein n=1 Tax=Sphaerisporangium sp. TRM90804 TaxID=3031113 RepID=UPI00244A4085|nr:FtsX-like permease family protein [Sphaerisporangium sp. TRM90804]MDH2425108.1 hypothetical protein [Sphaerisporangium sp. TRM90804]
MNPLILLRAHRGTAAVLAVLALSTALLIAALPRQAEASYDDALHGILDDTAASLTDLTVSQRPRSPEQHVTTDELFKTADARWRSLLPPVLASAQDRSRRGAAHYGVKSIGTPVAGRLGGGERSFQYVDLAWLSGAAQRVRYVEGRPPGPPSVLARVPGLPELRDVPRFDVALVENASDRMAIPVGTTLVLGNSRPILARVTGLFQVLDKTDRYWQHELDLTNVTVRRVAGSDVEEHRITGLTDLSALGELSRTDRDLMNKWVIALDPSVLTSRNAVPVIAEVGDYQRFLSQESAKRVTSSGQIGAFVPFELHTGLADLLRDFMKRLGTAQALMALIIGGLAVVAIGVIALTVQLMTERLRPALGLARARGASLAQVAGAGTGVVALAVVPAAVVGYALSYLVPGPVTPVVHLGPLLLSAVAVAYAAVRLAFSHRKPLNQRREDVVARRPSPRRVVVELLAVVLALGGAYLLRTRGLTTEDNAAQGADPFLMLVPAALTVAAALITLRCYPFPLRLVVRLAARARPAVPFVGLTLAARARSVTALPVLILLPALAVSVYGAVVGDALDATQHRAAWQATGAAARVDSAAELSPEAVERVRRVPGVRGVVPADKGTVQLGLGGSTATVVAVDLDAYRRILAGTPLQAPPPAPAPDPSAIPVLVSPDLAHLSTFEIGWHVRMNLTKAGTITGGLPGVSFTTENLIVVPYDASKRAGARLYTTLLLIQGDGIDPAQLRAAVGDRRDILVSTVEQSLGKVTATPLTATITGSFLVATIALGVYALLTVVIALVVGAAERARALSYLRTLGLSERQAANLTVLEITPLVVLTACAGLVLGLVLPSALGPSVDLSVYAGDLAVRDYEPGVTTPVLLAAGLAAVAVAGAFLHAVIGRRRSLGSILRVGE